MTILDTSTRAHVESLLVTRDAELADINSERLENWKRRSFRDPVIVPEASVPPKWPSIRSSLEISNVTSLPKRRTR